MKLLSFSYNGYQTFGCLQGNQVLDLGSTMTGGLRSLQAVIQQGALAACEEARANAPAVPLDQIEYLPPVRNPGKILCVGINYMDRNEEYKDGTAAPAYPSLFMRTPDSLVGHGQPVLRPPESEQLDYEGEIVIVIGKEGRRIPEAQAADHIFGLTLMNEGSVRDWLRHSKFNVTPGKNFHKSGSLGPVVVTADEIADYNDLRVQTRVNGELRQDGHTGDLVFPFTRIVNYISTFMTLHPGDIIATGTPTGAGARFDPPRWLVPGDVVEVSCEPIGVLHNVVADEGA
ncbi:MAG: fumarylacetoacetate hydrolase family protein [Rhizobiales bacterium]|nr:fumarylacetoacetate hydrolase family protein [Hyphomicrobiales bacterium]